MAIVNLVRSDDDIDRSLGRVIGLPGEERREIAIQALVSDGGGF